MGRKIRQAYISHTFTLSHLTSSHYNTHIITPHTFKLPNTPHSFSLNPKLHTRLTLSNYHIITLSHLTLSHLTLSHCHTSDFHIITLSHLRLSHCHTVTPQTFTLSHCYTNTTYTFTLPRCLTDTQNFTPHISHYHTSHTSHLHLISTPHSPYSGGTNYTITGTNLHVVQEPRLLFYYSNEGAKSSRQRRQAPIADAVSEVVYLCLLYNILYMHQ